MKSSHEMLQNLSQNVQSKIWALLPTRAVAVNLLNGEAFDAARREYVAAAVRDSTRNAGRVAIIPVYGILLQQDYAQIGNAIAAANADDGISQILLNINSPGGSVYGTQELADQIYRSKKRVVALANSLAASAAYWIGSQCSEFFCTPSGEVGSIGVYVMHTDLSAMMEKLGESITLIYSGKHKVDGNPYQPLSVSARQHMQHSVDGYYSSFVAAVARGRNVAPGKVRTGFGEGRVLSASKARAESMIDGIATLPQLVANLQKVIRFPGLASARRALAMLEGGNLVH